MEDKGKPGSYRSPLNEGLKIDGIRPYSEVEGIYTHYIDEQIPVETELGLHLRAASKFVRAASKYPGKIAVRKDDIVATNGKSIVSLTMLGALKGSKIDVFFEPGWDHEHVYETLRLLMEDEDYNDRKS